MALARRRHHLPPDPTKAASAGHAVRMKTTSKVSQPKRERGQDALDGGPGVGSLRPAHNQHVPSQQLLLAPTHEFAVTSTAFGDVQMVVEAASRSLLAALETAQLRDRFLAMEVATTCDTGDAGGASCAHGLGFIAVGRVGASVVRDIPAGVRRSLHLCLLQLSSSLRCDDFTHFIVDGLDDHQRHAVEFLSSSLANWAVPATRPLRFDFTHSPDSSVIIPEAVAGAATHSQYTERGSASTDEPTPAQLLRSTDAAFVLPSSVPTAVPALHLEFTSDAYETFLRWDNSMAVWQSNLVRAPRPVSSVQQTFNAFAQTPLAPIQVGINCLSLSEESPIGSSSIVNSESRNTAAIRGTPSEGNHFSPPSCKSSSSQSGFSHEQHASWCDSKGGSGAVTSAAQLNRTSYSKWRSHFCSCALSVPLPAVVQVNHAFEELFGVTATQVKKGFEEFGMGFLSSSVQHNKSTPRRLSTVHMISPHIVSACTVSA
jgi:hypothetical protein